MTRIQANLFLLFSGAIWGAGFVAQSTALRIGTALVHRPALSIATLVHCPLALLEKEAGRCAVAAHAMRNFVFVGLALFGGAVTQQYGLLTTTVTNSGFLTGLYVVFVPVLTVVFLRRRPHWVIWPAALLAASHLSPERRRAFGADRRRHADDRLCPFWAVQLMCWRLIRSGPRAGRCSCR